MTFPSSPSLCMIATFGEKGGADAIQIVETQKANPRFQVKQWSERDNRYIGPFWEVTTEDGRRVRAGGVHMIKRSSFETIEQFTQHLFCAVPQMSEPIETNDAFAIWSRGKDCVALKDGTVYAINLREGKPWASLFPVQAPAMETSPQFAREGMRA